MLMRIAESKAISGIEMQSRVPYYLLSRVSSACFAIASRILQIRIPGSSEIEIVRRRNLFSQVLEIVRRYVSEFVVFADVPHEEIGLDYVEGENRQRLERSHRRA